MTDLAKVRSLQLLLGLGDSLATAPLAADRSIGCSWTGPKDRNFSSEVSAFSVGVSLLGVAEDVGDEWSEDGVGDIVSGSRGRGGGPIGRKGNR